MVDWLVRAGGRAGRSESRALLGFECLLLRLRQGYDDANVPSTPIHLP